MHLKPREQHPRRIVLTLLAVAAAGLAWLLIALLGTANSGGTYAAWKSSVTIQGAVLKTGDAGVSASGFAGLTGIFAPWAPSIGAPVTITNTGTVPLRSFSTRVQLPSTSSSALAAATTVSIWPVAAGTTSCTTPVSGVTGTWAAMSQNWLASQGPLAPHASATYCVLTTISSAGLSADAGVNVSPAVQVKATMLTTGGWSTGWVSADAFTQSGPPVSQPAPTAVQNAVTATSIYGFFTRVTDVQEQLFPTTTCYAVSIQGWYGFSTYWSVTIDTTAPGLNASAFRNWDLKPQGYATGTWGTPNNSGSVLVAGVGRAGGNTAFSNTSPVNNTPVSGNNVAQLSFCVPTS